MLRSLLNLVGSSLHRQKMNTWRAKVDWIVRQPPGTDEGFSAEDIGRCARTSFSELSTWEIVCEEVLDTTHPCIYYERARDELRRRGIPEEAYKEMRRFAWLTTGWLNYEKMLWEWCRLDERDIQFAIEWQFRDGWISQGERERLTQYAKQYMNVTAESQAPAPESKAGSLAAPPPAR
jgi:hypothetical protein